MDEQIQYHDFKKRGRAIGEQPLENKLEKIQKEIKRIDQSSESINSGSSQFYQDLTENKLGFNNQRILISLRKNKAPHLQQFLTKTFVNRL